MVGIVAGGTIPDVSRPMIKITNGVREIYTPQDCQICGKEKQYTRLCRKCFNAFCEDCGNMDFLPFEENCLCKKCRDDDVIW
jgi:hypothetical protein